MTVWTILYRAIVIDDSLDHSLYRERVIDESLDHSL